MTQPLPFYIDPSVGTDGASTMAEFNMYDALVRINFNGTVIPWVAKSWSSSSDGLTWTFTINKGIKFHDNTTITADDVAWSMTRFLTIGTGRAYVLTPFVQSATALNDTAVQFKLKSSFGPFVSALSYMYVLNKDLVSNHLKTGGQYGTLGDYGSEWLASNDAGSGAYKVTLFNPGEKLVVTKFNGYWAGFKAKSPDIVDIIGTTEAMTVRTMLSNNELSYSDEWQTIENLQAISQLPNVKIVGNMDVSGGWFLMMNTKKAPLDDVHVRRALAYAYDYNTLTTTLFPDTIKMQGPVNSATPGFDKTLPQYTYDVTKAKAELALSKYASNITKYTIDLHWCAEVPDEEKGALLFQSNAAVIGIDVNVVKTPWTSMVQEASSVATKPGIEYISASADYPEAGSLLSSRYSSDNALTWWQNENLFNTTIDTQLSDALKTIDTTARMAKYAIIEQEIVKMCPTIFMYQGIYWRAYQSYVTIPYMQNGQLVKQGSLGPIYSFQGNVGYEFRLFQVDRLQNYAG
jgi:peptide/nickel transport system substrate-binding protein